MALTKFVNNVDDLSDDGGFKFRFHCDRCGDGYDSHYVAASANLLKTAVEVFSIFNPLGHRARGVAKNLDRGLRGKERDQAYENAVHAAMSHFRKCSACGKWVCPEHCFNDPFGLCEGCAPNASEVQAKRAAELVAKRAREAADSGAAAPLQTCPTCGVQTKGGKFCESCGSALDARVCKACRTALSSSARFCGECGTAAT